jgi:hypothetical protein
MKVVKMDAALPIDGKFTQQELDECCKIMNQKGLEYTQEELIAILHFVDRMAEIAVDYYERTEDKQQSLVITNYTDLYDEKKSIPLYSGEYRRAS